MESLAFSQQKDYFSNPSVIPTCGINKYLLLFDNLNSPNPLEALGDENECKLWQTTIFYVLQGECQFIVNGKKVNLKAGQNLITMPDCTFQFVYASSDIKYSMYVIYPEALVMTFNEIQLNYDITKISHQYYVQDCRPEDLRYFLNLYLELKADLIGPKYDYQKCYARCYLSVLFCNNPHIVSNIGGVCGDMTSRQYDVYKKFLIHLNQYTEKERSVKFYSDLQDISPKYLSFVCIHYSNKNASSWIDEYVATKAKALMKVHHYTVGETAVALNFNTQSSFVRYFKRVTGQSPKEFMSNK